MGSECRAGFLGDDEYNYAAPLTPVKEEEKYYLGCLTYMAKKTRKRARYTSSLSCEKAWTRKRH
jgi:hypothetical protein